jgi:hypothetical protein
MIIITIYNYYYYSAGAAERAAFRNQEKTANVSQSHIFQPLGFETFWPVKSTGESFHAEFGQIISKTSGDPQETQYVLQRFSVAIQRFISVASCSFEISNAQILA